MKKFTYCLGLLSFFFACKQNKNTSTIEAKRNIEKFDVSPIPVKKYAYVYLTSSSISGEKTDSALIIEKASDDLICVYNVHQDLSYLSDRVLETVLKRDASLLTGKTMSAHEFFVDAFKLKNINNTLNEFVEKSANSFVKGLVSSLKDAELQDVDSVEKFNSKWLSNKSLRPSIYYTIAENKNYESNLVKSEKCPSSFISPILIVESED